MFATADNPATMAAVPPHSPSRLLLTPLLPPPPRAEDTTRLVRGTWFSLFASSIRRQARDTSNAGGGDEKEDDGDKAGDVTCVVVSGEV